MVLDLLNVRTNISLAEVRQGFEDPALADEGREGELGLDGVEGAGLSPGLLALLSQSAALLSLLFTPRVLPGLDGVFLLDLHHSEDS